MKRIPEVHSSKQMAVHITLVIDIYIVVTGTQLASLNALDKDCSKRNCGKRLPVHSAITDSGFSKILPRQNDGTVDIIQNTKIS